MTMTYLEITNEALRIAANETPMSEQQFNNARSIQSAAKSAVNTAYLEINAESNEWPWLLADSAENTMSLNTVISAGEQRFSIPSNYNHIDMHSFYLTDKLVSSSTPREVSKTLPMITYDEWVRYYRDRDYKEDGDRGEPMYVFMYPNKEHIGITPKGLIDYRVEYNAWGVPTMLTDPNDVLPFPLQCKPVILTRAMYYLSNFMGDTDQKNAYQADYVRALAHMKQSLLNNQAIRMRAV